MRARRRETSFSLRALRLTAARVLMRDHWDERFERGRVFDWWIKRGDRRMRPLLYSRALLSEMRDLREGDRVVWSVTHNPS